MGLLTPLGRMGRVSVSGNLLEGRRWRLGWHPWLEKANGSHRLVLASCKTVVDRDCAAPTVGLGRSYRLTGRWIPSESQVEIARRPRLDA